MNSLYTLIDYYNLMSDKDRHILNVASHRRTIDTIYRKILEADKKLGISGGDINMRFYGGWTDENGDHTNDRFMVGAIIKDIPKRLARSGIRDGVD